MSYPVTPTKTTPANVTHQSRAPIWSGFALSLILLGAGAALFFTRVGGTNVMIANGATFGTLSLIVFAALKKSSQQNIQPTQDFLSPLTPDRFLRENVDKSPINLGVVDKGSPKALLNFDEQTFESSPRESQSPKPKLSPQQVLPQASQSKALATLQQNVAVSASADSIGALLGFSNEVPEHAAPAVLNLPPSPKTPLQTPVQQRTHEQENPIPVSSAKPKSRLHSVAVKTTIVFIGDLASKPLEEIVNIVKEMPAKDVKKLITIFLQPKNNQLPLLKQQQMISCLLLLYRNNPHYNGICEALGKKHPCVLDFLTKLNADFANWDRLEKGEMAFQRKVDNSGLVTGCEDIELFPERRKAVQTPWSPFRLSP